MNAASAAPFHHTLNEARQPARVVVLGGTGFIGSHVCGAFAALGIERVAVSSKHIDLTGADAVASLARVIGRDDTLVFASCVTRDRGDSPALLMRNLAMADHVGRFLERDGCAHVIYLSSDAIYKTLPYVNEASEQSPTTLYGLAHVVRERMMTYSCLKAGIPLAILRPCAVYGPGNTHETYGPNRFLHSAMTDGRIAIVGHGEELRHHIFVGDVGRIVAESAARQSVGALNVATDRAVSFRRLAETVARIAGRGVDIVSVPRQFIQVTDRWIDVTAVCGAFPALSFTTLEDGLRQTASSLAAV